MYTVKAFTGGKEYLLHVPGVKALTIGNAYFEVGDNINGQAEFSIYPGHPYYGYVKKLTTDIVFYKDGEAEFYGRVLYDDEDTSGTKKVFVEGELAFLCDSIQSPKAYHNYSVKDYFARIIKIHNSQVEKRKAFTVGRVTVTDPNDSLYRYSNWEDTRTTLKEKLTDRLGGHIVIRHENGNRIIDYLSDADFYVASAQTVEFGKNLIDYAKNIDASEIATCIIPLGARLEESSIEGLEERLTITSVNGGLNYVSDTAAVSEYGKIYKTVYFDDVTVPENLMKKGKKYLTETQFENMVITAKAVDLNLVDRSTESFRIGHRVRCISPPRGMDMYAPLSKKRVYISDIKKNTLTFGNETRNATYTSSNRQSNDDIIHAIQKLPSKKDILNEALKEATDIINAHTQSGHAIHLPNEFIVADTPAAEGAKNLWRWGLGGLAHYSDGYDGPADGVALTMDGKINGEMIRAGSIEAASISAAYKTSVENKIKVAANEANEASNDYTDKKTVAVMQETQTVINNLNDQITLSVSRINEKVFRKNYVYGGEGDSSMSGHFMILDTEGKSSVSKEEYLNMNCLKIVFTQECEASISIYYGSLDAGTYQTSFEVAFPAEHDPVYVACGLSRTRESKQMAGYAPERFHKFSVTENVEADIEDAECCIDVYGVAGTVCYLTNLRLLRDASELIDGLDAKLTVEAEKISATVQHYYNESCHNYCDEGTFELKGGMDQGWEFYGEADITEYQGKRCVKLTRPYGYPKSGAAYMVPSFDGNKVRIRLKACTSGNERLARIGVNIGGKSITKYSGPGMISSSWSTLEFDFEVSKTPFDVDITNDSYKEPIYITDVEILGNIAAYAENRISVLQDGIEMEASRAKGAEDLLSSRITQTAEQISSEVSRAKGAEDLLSSRITQTAEQISSEVSRAKGAEDSLSSRITQTAESIQSAVKKDEFGSTVTQYYDKVITAFNKNSKYVQLSAGELAIYDNGVELSKKRSAFDERGNHFYRDGYYVGKIGTNESKSNAARKGLTFDLDTQGSYMSWAAKTGADNYYVMKFTYVQSGYDVGDYVGGRLHSGADIDMHGFKLINPAFEGGGVSGTLNFVQVLEMDPDGTVRRWSDGCSLVFKNGILIEGKWNG